MSDHPKGLPGIVEHDFVGVSHDMLVRALSLTSVSDAEFRNALIDIVQEHGATANQRVLLEAVLTRALKVGESPLSPKTFEFEIVIQGVPLTDAVMDALRESGCGDSTPSMRDGYLYLTFARKAETLDKAVDSALADVKRAGIGGMILMVHRDLRR